MVGYHCINSKRAGRARRYLGGAVPFLDVLLLIIEVVRRRHGFGSERE